MAMNKWWGPGRLQQGQWESQFPTQLLPLSWWLVQPLFRSLWKLDSIMGFGYQHYSAHTDSEMMCNSTETWGEDALPIRVPPHCLWPEPGWGSSKPWELLQPPAAMKRGWGQEEADSRVSRAERGLWKESSGCNDQVTRSNHLWVGEKSPKTVPDSVSWTTKDIQPKREGKKGERPHSFGTWTSNTK
jgi:hypothetical protein